MIGKIIVGNKSLSAGKNTSSFAFTDGAVVTGRVVGKNSDSMYTVSVAGQKLSVRSEIPLDGVSDFTARVSVTEKGVSLILSSSSKNADVAIQKIISLFSNSSDDSRIADYFRSIGLELTQSSFRLVQLIQQLGIKIDVSAAKKAVAVSKKIHNGDDETAQVSFMLAEKGLESGVEAVSAFMKNSSGKRNGQRDNAPRSPEQYSKKSDQIVLIDSTVIADYFKSVDEAAEKNGAGILTAFNLVRGKKNEALPLRHWIVLPFEWRAFDYTGDFRLLLDNSLNKLERIVIFFRKNGKKIIFVLYLYCKQIRTIKYGFSSENGSSEEKHFSDMLASLFRAAGEAVPDIECVDFDSISGFCVEDYPLSFVRGDA